MAASANTAALDIPKISGDWTVVVPRRRKHGKIIQKKIREPEQEQSWAPNDLEVDLDREAKLMQKMQKSLKDLESSRFYRAFLDQIQSPSVLDSLLRVLGSEPEMSMVIYGIGSIELYSSPRLQLSLAILIKRHFSWIGDIEVFDPILSTTESRVLQSFGCTVLSLNEHGRRQALKPTLFFMPHCEAELYDSLLEVNRGLGLLKHIALLGNSFEAYRQFVSEFKNSAVAGSSKHILDVLSFTDEFQIAMHSNEYYAAFHDSSWHFFCPNSEVEHSL